MEIGNWRIFNVKVLKGLALGLTGSFLFVALIILGIAFTINSTVLSPKFLINEIEKLDLSATAQQILEERLPSEVKPYLPAINSTLDENKLWIKEQIDYSINTLYNYLSGESNILDLTIETQPLKQSLIKNLNQINVKLPPSEQVITSDQFQQQLSDEIPSTITLNRDNIPSEVWQTIQQAKEITGYIRTTYFVLIVFSILLILLIILITREVKGAALSLGIIFLVVGAASLSALIVTQRFVPGSIPMNDLPMQIQVWLKQLIIDYLSPWKIYSIIILVLGVLLLITGFFFHSKMVKQSEIV
jgi:uncharacterized integral membrane protein